MDELVCLQGLPEEDTAVAVPHAGNVHAKLFGIKVQHRRMQAHLVEPHGVCCAGRVDGLQHIEGHQRADQVALLQGAQELEVCIERQSPAPATTNALLNS